MLQSIIGYCDRIYVGNGLLIPISQIKQLLLCKISKNYNAYVLSSEKVMVVELRQA